MSASIPALPPFSTPGLVVDLDVFDANVAAMAGLLDGTRQDGAAARQDASDAGARPAPAGRSRGRRHVRHRRRSRGHGRGRARRRARGQRGRRSRQDRPPGGPRPRGPDRRGGRRPGAGRDALACRRGRGRHDPRPARPRRRAPALRAGERRGGPRRWPPWSSGSPGSTSGGIMGYEGRIRLSVENRDAKIAGAYAFLAEVRAALLAAGSRSRPSRHPARPLCGRRSPTRPSPSCSRASTA